MKIIYDLAFTYQTGTEKIQINIFISNELKICTNIESKTYETKKYFLKYLSVLTYLVCVYLHKRGSGPSQQE